MSFYVKIQLKVKISLAENFEQSRKKIEKNFFSTKKSEIFMPRPGDGIPGFRK